MTKKNKTFKVGDRVRWLYDDGGWSGDIGTVASVPDTPKYNVNWDVGITAAYEAKKLALEPVPAEPVKGQVTNRLYRACQAMAEEYARNIATVEIDGSGMPGPFVMEVISALEETE